MPPKVKDLLLRWIITTLAVLITAEVVPGIEYDTGRGLLVATLMLGLLNVFLRPLMVAVTIGALGVVNFVLGMRLAMRTLPLQFIFFGFLLLAINALLLLFVSRVVPAFHVNTFATAFWGGLLIGVLTLALNVLTGRSNSRIEFRRGPPPPPTPRSGGDDGPVIDV